jgi:NADPH2:quinone reductase
MDRTGGPEVLTLVEVPSPVPAPDQVVVRAESIGVGWVDVMIRTGRYRWMPPLPTSPGSDMAGHVVAVGSAVDPQLLGQPVLVTARELPVRGGCYAEELAVPASAIYVLPEGRDLDEAVCLPNYQVAWNLVHEVEPGRAIATIFVNGVAGGVGSAVAQLAKAGGIEVFGSVSSAGKAQFAVRLGVDHVIDYRTEDVVARVLELTAGRGVDRVVDPVGGAGFAALIRMLADWGTVISYNASGGLPPDNLLQALRDSGAKCPAVRVFEMHIYDHDRPNRRRIMQAVIDSWAAGRIAPAVSTRLPLSSAREAHEMLEKGESLGKIVLKPALAGA